MWRLNFQLCIPEPSPLAPDPYLPRFATEAWDECRQGAVFCPFRMALGKSWNFDFLKFGLTSKEFLEYSYSIAYVHHQHWFSPDEEGVCTSCGRLQVH